MSSATLVTPAVARDESGRLPMSAVIPRSITVTVTRPTAWLLGLAGFLAGGGVLLVAAPVTVLPTLTGIQNALGGPVSTLVVGTPSPALLAMIWGSVALGVGLLAAGLLAGAWAERQLIFSQLDAATRLGLAVPTVPRDAPGTLRVAAVRLLSLLPLSVVAMLASRALYNAAYGQLVLPDELSTPLGVRVVREVPGPVVAVVATWLVSDAAAAVGVRRLLIGRHGVLAAWARGWTELVRRPLRVLGAGLFGLVVLGAVVVPSLVASSAGWTIVRREAAGSDALALVVSVVGLVILWLAGLLLVGLGAAVRAAAWTLEAAPVAAGHDDTA